MDKAIIKCVYQIVGNSYCVEEKEGEGVYEILCEFIKEKHPVNLSFMNIKLVTVSFLNSAIGKLYKVFTEEEIRTYLTVSNIDDIDKVLLKKVVSNAKEYYKNPTFLEESFNKVIEE